MLDRIYFNRQYTNKVSVSNSGHAYVVKGKSKREVGQVNASGQERDISSYFTAFTDKEFNDIQSTDSNYVFIATQGDFLLRYDGTATKHLKQEHGLQNGFITSLAGRYTLYLGNSLGLFNSQNRGYTKFAPTYSLNNPTIGMRYTERAEVFTVDRGLNFQYQHPPVMPHYCYYRSPFTHFIVPANFQYRTHSFGLGKPDTSHVYTAHHVIPFLYNGYAHYETYHYVGTRTGLRKAFAHSCEARVYLPRRRVYKLLEVRTYPNEIFGTPALEQRYLLSATDSGLYVNKILSNDRAEDTFQLVAGTSHLQIFDIDTDECYSKLWLATNQGLYSFSINHKLNEIKPELTHSGVKYVCFNPSFRIATTLAKGYTVQWLKDGVPIPGAINRQYDATEPGTYQALLKPDCYNTTISSAEVMLRRSILTEVPITSEGNLTKCPDEVVTLSTTAREDYTYQWFRNNQPLTDPGATSPVFTTTMAGTYKVSVTNCYGSSVSSGTIVIKTNDLPKPVISLSTDKVCIGSSIELSVPEYDGKIEWLLDGKTIASDEGHPNKFTASYESSGYFYQVYRVRYTNKFGCSYLSEPAYVYFYAAPSITIDRQPSGRVCLGTSQRLRVNTSSWDAIIRWSTGSTNSYIDVTTPGRYTVTVTNRTGCSTNETIEVDFNPVPMLALPSDTTICEASLIPLQLVAGPPDIQYTLNDKLLPDNIIRISNAGTFTVIATDKNGCAAFQTLTVQNFCNDLVIPNVITPNGDNLNDWFFIQNLVPNCDLKVFNRSGILVYQNKDYQNNWQGEKLPNGVYYYILSSSRLNRTWKGWVEIIN